MLAVLIKILRSGDCSPVLYSTLFTFEYRTTLCKILEIVSKNSKQTRKQ